MQKFPFITLVVIVAAFGVYQIPDANPALAYDRAAILDGQAWRLITGHWVHFSWSHLAYDTLVLGMAGAIIEQLSHRLFASLCMVISLLTGTAMFAFQPQLRMCGGLSGLATGAITFLAVTGLKEKGMWRWFCIAILFLVTGKILFEAVTGSLLFLHSAETSFVPVPINHLMGAMAGCCFGIKILLRGRSHETALPLGLK